MKALYLVPAAAFLLILANALYGHSVFGASHPEAIAKYSVYVHLQEEWDSHPSNILFEVTDVWDGDGVDVYYEAAEPPPLEEHNYNRVGDLGGLEFVELRHRFSDCRASWQPILYRYALDTVRNAYEVAAGASEPHPYALMYPDVPGEGSGAPARYVQFIPVCGDGQSYQYSVRTDDPGAPLDVAFVPDASGIDEASAGLPVPGAYEGCGAQSRASFSGRCDGISGGGLLVSVPDSLGRALAKVTVNLYEVP